MRRACRCGNCRASTWWSGVARRFAGRQQGGGFDIALIPLGAYEPRWFM